MSVAVCECLFVFVNIYLTRTVYLCLTGDCFNFLVQRKNFTKKKRMAKIARILIFIHAAVDGSKLNTKTTTTTTTTNFNIRFTTTTLLLAA